jgi:hypothetical protein
VTTFGGNYFGAWDLGPGKIDLLGWGSFQRGDWGALDHRAWSFDLEAGYQLPEFPWKPWLRAGWGRASGDDDPRDGTHGTFFPHIAARLYSRTPFYTNPMNNEDLFVQLLLRPMKALEVRLDAHRLRLSEREDFWYTGAYAFRNDSFGFTGRPANGHKNLSNLVDVSFDYKFTPHTRVTFYAGHGFGGDVPRAIYAGNKVSFFYWELFHTF